MNKFQIPIVIAITDDVSILQCDIGGMAAGEYLLNTLNQYRKGCLEVFGYGSQLDKVTTFLDNFSNIKVPRLDDFYIKGWQSTGVLVVDSRAWISCQTLDKIFECIKNAKTGFCFYEALKQIPYMYRNPMMLAVYIPPGNVILELFQNIKLSTNKGLQTFFNLELFDKWPKIYHEDFNASTFCLLIDSYVDLASIERQMYLQRAITFMKKGVRIRDPHTVYIRGEMTCGFGVEIDANVILEGDVVLGDNVKINSNSLLRDCSIGTGTVINPFSLIEQSSVGEDSFIGPFGRIRPGCVIGNKVQIGNYVEIKNSHIGDGARINHHTFIGDSLLADDVTIGAGTITCNHDGIGVSETVIEQGAYIGSGCNLVAPLNIGTGATIGAGSTITRDVPAEKLTVARSIQTTVHGWVRPKIQRVGK